MQEKRGLILLAATLSAVTGVHSAQEQSAEKELQQIGDFVFEPSAPNPEEPTSGVTPVTDATSYDNPFGIFPAASSTTAATPFASLPVESADSSMGAFSDPDSASDTLSLNDTADTDDSVTAAPSVSAPVATIASPAVITAAPVVVHPAQPKAALKPAVPAAKKGTASKAHVVVKPAPAAKPVGEVVHAAAPVKQTEQPNVVVFPPLGEKVVQAKPAVTISGPAESVTVPSASSSQQEAPVAEQQQEEVIPVGLDTISVNGEGNWLLKRVWWENAEQVFEQIVTANDKLVQVQMAYVGKRSAIDKTVDTAFHTIGIEQGELQTMLVSLIERVDLLEQNDAELLAQERRVLQDIDAKKKQLEQVQQDVQMLSDMDGLATEAVTQLLSVVNQCRDYERKAWQNFKEIGRVLSDEKAKQLFYEIDTYYKNIQRLSAYVQNDLAKYIDTLVANTQKQVDSITNSLQQLEADGLGIKATVEQLKQLAQERSNAKMLAASKPTAAPKPVKKGFFASLGDSVGGLWTKAKGLVGK